MSGALFALLSIFGSSLRGDEAGEGLALDYDGRGQVVFH